MSGITDALKNAANNMLALEQDLNVIQQNVGNASTPGYARQDLGSAIDSASDANVTQTISSRDEFSETAVRNQNSLYGYYNQLNGILQRAQQNFPASADSGIPNAIDNLFNAFSALTTSPNDTTARSQALQAASQLAQSFHTTSNNLQTIEGDTREQILSQVDTINHLASLVEKYNTAGQLNSTGKRDPISDAKLHDTLEQLAEYANVTTLTQSDGSITLLLGGQTALVVGSTQYKIAQGAGPNGTAVILDANGSDITSQITGGRLSGSLQALNQTIPSYLTGLDQLATSIADSVNATLAGGVDANGAAGAPLFTYNTASDAASTLAVTDITTDQLAAASASAPGGNGNALALSALATAQNLNGFTYAGFYGNLAAQVGHDVSTASSGVTVQTQLLSQARAQRTSVSGVSLDDEAVQLIEFQRAYQAGAKIVAVLDQVSQDTINMLGTV